MKKVFKYYAKYLKWLERYNRLVKARNARRAKAWDGQGLKGPEREKQIEASLTGFLKWGAENEAS